MGDWKQIWNSKKSDLIENGDMKQLYKQMRLLDGYDAIDKGGIEVSWNELIEEWKRWNRNLNFSKYTVSMIDLCLDTDMIIASASFEPNQKESDAVRKIGEGAIKSVFEVGCGSGPNLLLFQKFYKDMRVGGIDYSDSLIEVAKKFIQSNDLVCNEAVCLDVSIKYDAVISYSVFHYFPDYEYAWGVLEKMYKKANRVIGILDIHDLRKKESFLNYRRSLTPDYDNRYKGLDKLFFDKTFFLEFAEKFNCDVKFEVSNVGSYWNNQFVYHCYLYKQKELPV